MTCLKYLSCSASSERLQGVCSVFTACLHSAYRFYRVLPRAVPAPHRRTAGAPQVGAKNAYALPHVAFTNGDLRSEVPPPSLCLRT